MTRLGTAIVDTAYRSANNEAMLMARGLVLRIHRKSQEDGRCRSACARPEVKIGLANLVYGIRRLVWLSG